MESITKAIPTVSAILYLRKTCRNKLKIEITQNDAITARTRLKDTTSLYLIPNDKANSLSTLMAVDVNMDTPHKTKLDILFTAMAMSRMLHVVFVIFVTSSSII